jgi:S-adenosylmethionine hydrolase
LTGAFLLKSSFKYFPKGSLHLVVVDPGVGSERKNLLVKTKDYFFVAPDNGVLSLALKDQPPLKIIEITNERYFLKPISNTFHGRDIFAPTAAYLSKGEDFSRFGKRIKSIKELRLPQAKIASKGLIGEIIHIDRFGNLVSNIDKEMLDNFIKGKKFKIFIKNKTIDKLSHSYSEGTYLKLLALIDSFNYLEIALNRGSACDYLKAKKGTKVIVSVTSG